MKLWQRGASYTVLLLAALMVAQSAAQKSERESGSAITARHMAKPQFVGHTVLLRLQREGALVWDFRSHGRPLPAMQPPPALLSAPLHWKHLVSKKRAVVLLGDTLRTRTLAHQILQNANGSTEIYIVPAHLLEYHIMRGVPQWSIWQLQQNRQKVTLLDVSEAAEFAHKRVPDSLHVSLEDLKRSRQLPQDLQALGVRRGKPVAVI